MRLTRRELKQNHRLTQSWHDTANHFNQIFGVKLSKAAYSVWAKSGREPQNPLVRESLGLKHRPCPWCGRMLGTPRQSVKPEDPAMRWWRNGITAEQRRKFISHVYEVNANVR